MNAAALPLAAQLGPADTFSVDVHLGPVRRLAYRSLAAGQVTCVAHTGLAVGSAGVPLRADAVATARTAEAARQLALCRAVARYAAGFWQPEVLCAHPVLPPHGRGPGPWVQMQVGDGGRQVWMPAAQVFAPFRLGKEAVVGDADGLYCAPSLDQARQGAVDRQLMRRALQPLWMALSRQRLVAADALPDAEGERDVVVSDARGQSLAISFKWSLTGPPPYGVAGLGCAAHEAQAMALARSDRVNTEAQLAMQQAGVWGGRPEDLPPDMDPQVHALAWQQHGARAMAALLQRWHARARPLAGPPPRAGLAWVDLTPPDVRQMGLWVVRSLWLDGERARVSLPVPLSPRR